MRHALPSSLQSIREFLRAESLGGILLGAATLIALVWANVDFFTYDSLWSRRFDVGPENWRLSLKGRDWINDAAMAIDSARVAMLAASLVAATVGYSLLRVTTRPGVRAT